MPILLGEASMVSKKAVFDMFPEVQILVDRGVAFADLVGTHGKVKYRKVRNAYKLGWNIKLESGASYFIKGTLLKNGNGHNGNGQH